MWANWLGLGECFNTRSVRFQCPDNLTLAAKMQGKSVQSNTFSHLASQGNGIVAFMGDSPVVKFLKEIGSRGGQARAKALTAKERKAIATKASKAAAEARTRKAQNKKR